MTPLFRRNNADTVSYWPRRRNRRTFLHTVVKDGTTLGTVHDIGAPQLNDLGESVLAWTCATCFTSCSGYTSASAAFDALHMHHSEMHLTMGFVEQLESISPYLPLALEKILPTFGKYERSVILRLALHRFRDGFEEYGDTSFRKTRRELCGEVSQELADAVIWTAIALWRGQQDAAEQCGVDA